MRHHLVAEPAVAKAKVRPNNMRRRIIGDALVDCLEEGHRNVTDAESDATEACVDIDDTAKRDSIPGDKVRVGKAIEGVVGANPEKDGGDTK